MDDSWRLRLGIPAVPHIPNYPPRRSTEESTSKPQSGNPDLDVEDFSDVFGGPPRTILSRQFSTGFPRSSYSSASFTYEDIFRPLERAVPPPTRRSGRSLPQFTIPGKHRSSRNQENRQNKGFYSDIFGWEDEAVVRSRSRSKTNSSCILSPEELSPLRPVYSGDHGDDFACFASNLRPINVKSRWPSRGNAQEDCQGHNSENDDLEKSRSYPHGLSRRNPSPETISLEPISNGSFGVSPDDLEHNTPASAVSSVLEADEEQRLHIIEEQILRQDIFEEDDEVMSSYVIEINSDNKEGMCESNGVDEAIAWAKEKFQTHCPVQECKKEKTTEEMFEGHHMSEAPTDGFRSSDEQQDKWAVEEKTRQIKSMTEMEILDEKIRLWSIGKEADIRLLLSSLHHILWSNSGWLAVPLMNLIEASQVKKAYQKARLCLHPDKLQQRGATIMQKYVAERVFSVLQDAWGSFVSHDAFSGGKVADNLMGS